MGQMDLLSESTEDGGESGTNALLPDRYPQHDIFICDVADAVLKDIMQQMEHPFYSLSKKPEINIRRYEHNGSWLEVTPSVKGLATIYDKDILIYCISQIIAKLKRGEPVSKRVRVNSRELLIFTNRGTSGRDYMALVEAIERLRGTTITTNICTGNEEQADTFGLIDKGSIRRKLGLDGRLLWCEIVLSDWVFNAIRENEVLTLHRDYFRLRKPLERRVYELARKHCGAQSEWKISVPVLLKKSGSQSGVRRFRQMLRELAQNDHLPDYAVSLDEDHDRVVFRNRGTVLQRKKPPKVIETPDFHIDPDTYAEAREVAPDWDIYYLEREFRSWIDGKERPRNPDLAFVSFCRKWFQNHGRP